MEEAQNLMKNNKLNYQIGDLKPEIHFIGQITGASEINEDDGIFCEAFFEAGNDWKCLSPNNTIQTQTCYTNVNFYFLKGRKFCYIFTSI
jgi:hypothetical protein